MPLERVVINIIGPQNTGRTTLAVQIQNFLKECGYTDVKVEDTEPLPSKDKSPFPERFALNRSRPHLIRVVTQTAVQAPEMTKLPAQPPMTPEQKAKVDEAMKNLPPVQPVFATGTAVPAVRPPVKPAPPPPAPEFVWPEVGQEYVDKGRPGRRFIVREVLKDNGVIRGTVFADAGGEGANYSCDVYVFEVVWR